MTKDHPIIMSTPMVQAILEGRKTMTRRIINPQPIVDHDSGSVFDGKHRIRYDIHNWKDRFIDDWSRWMPEDLLWLRETFAEWEYGGYAYKASGFSKRSGAWEKDTPNKFHDVERIEKWKPSIYMPRKASRILLEVTNIGIEKLNEISEQDSIAEGVLFYDDEVMGKRYKDYIADARGYGDPDVDYPTLSTAKESYETLWQKLHGPESWEANPFCWVIKFKKT